MKTLYQEKITLTQTLLSTHNTTPASLHYAAANVSVICQTNPSTN